MSNSSRNPTVAVTGANGFIAAELVRQLLDAGYTVHGTVRSLANPERSAHLTGLPNASTRLKLFAADLQDAKAFAAAFKGVSAVFHVATPVLLNAADPVKDIVEPALQGTTNAFNAAVDAGASTFLFTSSIVTLYNKTIDLNHVYSEADFEKESDPLAPGFGQAYSYAKRIAEEELWKLAEIHKKQIRTVSLLPGLVLGPYVHDNTSQSLDKLPSSLGILKSLALGGPNEPIAPLGNPTVDVRDVAAAHIAALENKNATGRYLISNEFRTFADLAKDAKRLYPQLPIAEKEVGTAPLLRFSNERAVKDLGIHFRPLEESLKDTLAQWKQLNFFA